jgi:hypothetical protein
MWLRSYSLLLYAIICVLALVCPSLPQSCNKSSNSTTIKAPAAPPAAAAAAAKNKQHYEKK